MRVRTKIGIGILVGIGVLVFLFLMYPSYDGLPPDVGAPPRTGRPPSEPPRKPPPPRHPPDPLALVDRILERMEFGNIAFNTPRSMNLYDTASIQLLLGVATPIEELKRMVEAEGEKAGASIRISNRMEARLSGLNFKIKAITSETQAVSRTKVTEWEWQIMPESPGRQALHLTLSAVLSIEGIATPRTIRTFDRLIEVDVRWNQRVTGFIEKNWQWLWAAILVPLVGWLWKKRKSRSKRSNKKDDS